MAAAPEFATAVRTLRATRRMTQAELAQRAGISERAVSDIERGLRVRVYPATVQALADAFELAAEQRADFERAARTGRPAHPGERWAAGSAATPWRQLRRDAFVGRQAEVAALRAEFAERRHRLHTVTGPGGAGKSRLAAEVCAGFATHGRALWVALAGEQRPARIVAAVAAVLDVPADSGIRAIGAALDEVPTLLVLDTFEHLLDGATVVTDLLDATAGTQLLVTSRAPLRLRGERVVPLSGLTGDEAAQLFRDRAVAVRPDLPLTAAEATTAITDITTRLDGLPLALELAAAKLHQLSLPSLRDQLASPLALLGDGHRDLPERQRSMRATVRWSYELLDPAARATLRTLGCFAGVFDLGLATAVADAEDGLLARIGALTEHALVHPEPDAARDLDAPAWRLLDPIREFAVEHLLASGAARDVRHRHALAAADRAETEGAQLVGDRQDAARRRLRHLAPDIRAALRWSISAGEAAIALRIAGSMWMFWRLEGEFAEGRRLLGEVLAVSAAQAADVAAYRSAALWGAGWLALHQGDAAGAREAGTELLALAGDDLAVRRNGLTLLGEAALAERHIPEAVGLLEEALSLAERAGTDWQRAASRLNLGTVLVHAGEPERADAAVAAAVAAFAALGDRHFAARAMLERGYLAVTRRELEAARRYFADALGTFVAHGERWGTAEGVIGLAVLAAERGDAETAALLAAAVDRVHADIAVQLNPPDAMLVAERLARARALLGDAAWDAAWRDGAQLSLEDAVAIALDRGVPAT
jgi:predicted ATPase/DNA-binding XRE family transcriptional regulator